jgi:enamine deaminase RidA (YjgF/YER057c/UK114 family)
MTFAYCGVSLDCEGQVVGKGDMRAQVRRTLENIKAVLASIGGKMADIVSLTQYATDIEQFMASGDIRKEFLFGTLPCDDNRPDHAPLSSGLAD